MGGVSVFLFFGSLVLLVSTPLVMISLPFDEVCFGQLHGLSMGKNCRAISLVDGFCDVTENGLGFLGRGVDDLLIMS